MRGLRRRLQFWARCFSTGWFALSEALAHLTSALLLLVPFVPAVGVLAIVARADAHAGVIAGTAVAALIVLLIFAEGAHRQYEKVAPWRPSVESTPGAGPGNVTYNMHFHEGSQPTIVGAAPSGLLPPAEASPPTLTAKDTSAEGGGEVG